MEARDVDNAMEALLTVSQQSILRQFDLATASPRRENFYFQVLLACSLASTDDLGYSGRPTSANHTRTSWNGTWKFPAMRVISTA